MKNKIKVYNHLISNGFDDEFNASELYFYTLLKTKYIEFLGYSETTISIISESQLVFDDENESRRIQKVKNMILNLKEKGLISLEYKGILNKNTTIKIIFNEFNDGFVLVSKEIFFSISDYRQLYILLLIMKNKGVYERSKDRWSELFGYSSKNTGIEIVERMENEGLIHHIPSKPIPDGKGSFFRNRPKWYLGKKNETDGKSMENADELIVTASYGEITKSEMQNFILDSNWNKKNDGYFAELTYDDYELYRISVDEKIDLKFNKSCKIVIGKKARLGTYDGVFEKWEEQFLRDKEQIS